ncbi:hypothetical protein GGGNBK_09405 [Sporosarcina sp. ANT_H38]|nr:hypothetical protein [Sporosarcina sp. ANT_H38]
MIQLNTASVYKLVNVTYSRLQHLYNNIMKEVSNHDILKMDDKKKE